MRKSELIQRLCAVSGDPHIVIPMRDSHRFFIGLDTVTHHPAKINPRNPGVIALSRSKPYQKWNRIPMKTVSLSPSASYASFTAKEAKKLTLEAKDREIREREEADQKRETAYVMANLEPELQKILENIKVAATRGSDSLTYWSDHTHAQALLTFLTSRLRELHFIVDGPEQSKEDDCAWRLSISW